MRLLESKIFRRYRQILHSFLEDCWAALAVFKKVSGKLAGVIGADGEPQPVVIAAETLIKIKERLETSSNEVNSLPGTGIINPCQSLIKTASVLQGHAGDLIEEPAGHS